jgi:hypothetical protein
MPLAIEIQNLAGSGFEQKRGDILAGFIDSIRNPERESIFSPDQVLYMRGIKFGIRHVDPSSAEAGQYPPGAPINCVVPDVADMRQFMCQTDKRRTIRLPLVVCCPC